MAFYLPPPSGGRGRGLYFSLIANTLTAPQISSTPPRAIIIGSSEAPFDASGRTLSTSPPSIAAAI